MSAFSPDRRRLMLAGLAAASAAPLAHAQAYPNRPLRLVIPYPPGGGTDVFARTVAPKMAELLGQQVNVENRPGASGLIAAELVGRSSPADGYTVLLGDMGQYALNSSLFKKLPYDPQADFAPVTLTARFEFVIVVNPTALPVNNLKELIEAAKRSPNGLMYASPGVGVPHHLATELFANSAGIKVSPVHYKGGGPALQGLLGGEAPLMMGDVVTALPLIKAGKLRPIATPSQKRVEVLPDVPTLPEAGVPGQPIYAWQGLAVRSGTPDAVIQTLNSVYRKTIEDPAVRKALLERGGVEFTPSTPAEMGAYMRSETTRWREVIQRANITIEP